MKVGRIGLLVALIAGQAAAAWVPGHNAVMLRGQRQDVYYFPASAGGGRGKVLFAPGDGGWRGFAITIAETLAGWGYEVYGVDTRRYLTSFTGTRTLREDEVMADFAALARQAGGKVTLLGWSEGAGLEVLAAASPQKQGLFRGLVVVGLPESAVLGWRWSDNITWITRREPNEPHFATGPYLPRVAPLPLAAIHSSGDEYTSPAKLKEFFAGAQEPRQLQVVEAANHRFEGNREGFFRALKGALEWVERTAR